MSTNNPINGPQMDLPHGAGLGFGTTAMYGSDRQGPPLKLGTVLPVKQWLADRPFAVPLVLWFAFLAFFPFVLAQLFDNISNLRHAFWGLGLYYHVITGFILYVWLRPRAVPAPRILGVMAATVVVGMTLVLYVQKEVPLISELYGKLESKDFVPRLFGFVFGVGLIEELAKALPVLWLFLYKKQPVTIRECAFLAAVSGLAFGVAEAPDYCIRHVGNHLGKLGTVETLLTQLKEAGADPKAREQLRNLLLGSVYANFLVSESLRLISLPLLHAMLSGVMGFFIGLAVNLQTRKTALLLCGLGLTAGIHGLYNTAQSNPADAAWAAAPMLMIFLIFVGYARSAERILAALRAEEAAEGLTAR